MAEQCQEHVSLWRACDWSLTAREGLQLDHDHEWCPYLEREEFMRSRKVSQYEASYYRTLHAWPSIKNKLSKIKRGTSTYLIQHTSKNMSDNTAMSIGSLLGSPNSQDNRVLGTQKRWRKPTLFRSNMVIMTRQLIHNGLNRRQLVGSNDPSLTKVLIDNFWRNREAVNSHKDFPIVRTVSLVKSWCQTNFLTSLG